MAIMESISRSSGVENLVVVALVDGEEVMSHSVGSLSRDSTIRVYSMTKAVTSACILQLVDSGRLTLETKLSTIIEWPEDDVDVFDLLTHSAGLTYGFKDDPVAKSYREQSLELPRPITKHSDRVSQPPKDLGEFCERIGRLPRRTKKEFYYSASFDVLGRVVEKVSGIPFDAYCSENIFSPLGMTQTYFTLPADKELAPCFFLTMTGKVEVKGELWDAGRCPSGGGGLLSTVNDWLKFAEGLRTGFIPMIDQLSANQLKLKGIAQTDIAQFYPAFGLGVWTTTDADGNKGWLPPEASAFGWPGAAGTSFLVDQKNKLVVVIATQLLNSSHLMHGVYCQVHHHVYAQLEQRASS